MDENGAKFFLASYDAWGKQTVTLNTIGLHRGYTGHEMLSEFDIINMNGRLYDPVLGRFFSPDNYVQMPDNSQNFNRYSYCLNNPLKYTDPSGNLFGIDDAIIAFAAFNMASSMMQTSFEGKSVWKAGALSLLSSAASYGIGELFKRCGCDARQ
ncbi:RHS repeat-associated core domain protein [Bacteroidales bacterium KA00344]|nr:RHS repeat-associated core domain protein [Bacteroidales bacterium KA00344]